MLSSMRRASREEVKQAAAAPLPPPRQPRNIVIKRNSKPVSRRPDSRAPQAPAPAAAREEREEEEEVKFRGPRNLQLDRPR